MPNLEQQTLGRTGIPVTRLGYGGREVGGARRPVTPEQLSAILNATLDSGVTFIDTSPDYARSEAVLGEFLANRRSEFTLATKCGCKIAPNADGSRGSGHIYTRDQLLWNIDDSLAKLKTDYVDVLKIHNANARDVEENNLIDVLQEIKASGKARWIGISSELPSLNTFVGWGVFDVFQIPYSALDRRHEHLITRAHAAGIGTVVRSSVVSAEPGSGRRRDVWERAKLDDLLVDGVNRTQWLLRFTLSHPGVDTAIVGTTNPAHLAENVHAATLGPLPADIYAEAKRRLDAAGERPEEV